MILRSILVMVTLLPNAHSWTTTLSIISRSVTFKESSHSLVNLEEAPVDRTSSGLQRLLVADPQKRLESVKSENMSSQRYRRNKMNLFSSFAVVILACLAIFPFDSSNAAFAHGCVSSSTHSSADIRKVEMFDKKSQMLLSSIDDDMANLGKALDSKAWRESLTPPTDEKPQIKPPSDMQFSSQIRDSENSKAAGPNLSSVLKGVQSRNGEGNGRIPIIEGMVYMKDQNQRPDPSDIIVLTVSSPSQPDIILAGAKYPVYKARIPFNFRFYNQNIIKGKESTFVEAAKGEDFFISAAVCRDPNWNDGEIRSLNDLKAPKLPCSKEERTFEAKGISKLLKVPGMDNENDDLFVRAPAALPLEITN